MKKEVILCDYPGCGKEISSQYLQVEITQIARDDHTIYLPDYYLCTDHAVITEQECRIPIVGWLTKQLILALAKRYAFLVFLTLVVVFAVAFFWGFFFALQ